MKVRVLKAFYDAHHKNKLRFEGTIYEERLKRAVALQTDGLVKLIEPEIKTVDPVPEDLEKKAGRPKGFSKVPKKKPTRTKKIRKYSSKSTNSKK